MLIIAKVIPLILMPPVLGELRTDDDELSEQPSEELDTKPNPDINENPPARSSTYENNHWKCMVS